MVSYIQATWLMRCQPYYLNNKAGGMTSTLLPYVPLQFFFYSFTVLFRNQRKTVLCYQNKMRGKIIVPDFMMVFLCAAFCE